MRRSEVLPIAMLALILVPSTLKLVGRAAPAPVAESARAPEPVLPRPPATPRAWFDMVRTRCTPGEVRLATDLNRPPAGAEGTGYKAACFALAGQISTARALLLGLPEADRPQGVAPVDDMARELAGRGRHDLAGPLAELVLEFWPDREVALYAAGMARWADGDRSAARDYLERFLELHPDQDELTDNARRTLSYAQEE